MRGDPGGEKIGQKGEMQSKRENGGVTIKGTAQIALLQTFVLLGVNFTFEVVARSFREYQLRYHYNSCIIFMHVYCI